MHLFHSAVTEKEDEKDILTKNPEFLGAFCCPKAVFSDRVFVDVKLLFSRCQEI